MQSLKTVVKSIPILGNVLVALKRKIYKKDSAPRRYTFQRKCTSPVMDLNEKQHIKILNLLEYTKMSGASYSARHYPAGYHSIYLSGRKIQGQRDPAERLKNVPFNFEGKSVLDLGSNQGGMLFQVSDKIRWGIGLDYDYRMVNIANKISYSKISNCGFYVFDFEKDPLELIPDLLPEDRVDIIFLLSVCMWVKNWEELIEFCVNISDTMLFESNGTDQQQNEQEQKLRSLFVSVHKIAESSEDDPKQKNRRLFICDQSV